MVSFLILLHAQMFYSSGTGHAKRKSEGKSQHMPTMAPSLGVVDHKNLEQLQFNLLSIDHCYSILQQLIPSCEHDHTYCRPINAETQASELPYCPLLETQMSQITDGYPFLEKHQVYLELSVTPARHSVIEILTQQQTETPLWPEVHVRHILDLKVE